MVGRASLLLEACTCWRSPSIHALHEIGDNEHRTGTMLDGGHKHWQDTYILNERTILSQEIQQQIPNMCKGIPYVNM